MTWYVKIPKINGRINFVLLAEQLGIRGFDDRVEYHEGGWEDNVLETTLPHLKFEFEDDAIAYILAYGGEISKTVPIVVTGIVIQ
jgi:hypothetical protein